MTLQRIRVNEKHNIRDTQEYLIVVEHISSIGKLSNGTTIIYMLNGTQYGVSESVAQIVLQKYKEIHNYKD